MDGRFEVVCISYGLRGEYNQETAGRIVLAFAIHRTGTTGIFLEIIAKFH